MQFRITDAKQDKAFDIPPFSMTAVEGVSASASPAASVEGVAVDPYSEGLKQCFADGEKAGKEAFDE